MTTGMNGLGEAQDVPIQPLKEIMGKQEADSTTLITEKTRIPIGLAVSCVIALAGASIWINNSLSHIEARLTSIETRLLDRWTASDMRVWTLKFKMENPSIKIPEPETIHR